jgi:hypothetical protein
MPPRGVLPPVCSRPCAPARVLPPVCSDAVSSRAVCSGVGVLPPRCAPPTAAAAKARSPPARHHAVCPRVTACLLPRVCPQAPACHRPVRPSLVSLITGNQWQIAAPNYQ